MKTNSCVSTLATILLRPLFHPGRWALAAILTALALLAVGPAAEAQVTPFISAGSLNTARFYHTATLLPDGRVLVAGGLDQNLFPVASAEIYDPASGTWTPTGSLVTARSQHTATLLPNGQVLVAGGFNNSTIDGKAFPGNLADAELYDPASGAWQMTGSLTTARSSHTATLLPKGQVLVAGGFTGSSTAGASAAAELYDPASGSWTATGSLLAGGRTNHTATLLADGQVLVAGGRDPSSNDLATANLYNPATASWTAAANLNTGRYLHSATLLPNGQILAVGGYNGSTQAGLLASAELYDPTADTWTATGSLNAARYLHTATLLANGQVVIAGGSGGDETLASAERYNPASGSWVGTGSLNTARGTHTTTLLPNGQVLVAGGAGSGNYIASAELYDPTAGSWTATGNLHTGRLAHTATLLPTGQVLVVGGYNNGEVLASAELYDPTTGSWTTTGNLITAREVHTATLLPNGQVLVAGGLGLSGDLISAELYDPASGSWTTTGSLNTARSAFTATLLPNGQVLAAGGNAPSSYLASAELYDPTSGSWTTTGSLNTARSSFTATLLPNGQVLAAAGSGSTVWVASAELYDPANSAWTTTGSLNTARDFHTATLLPNGQVLVAGGDGSSGDLASAELYDPAGGSWMTTGSLNTARNGHTSTLLLNGRVLVAAGSNGAPIGSAELYDVGLGFAVAAQPQITGVASPLLYGGSLALSGAGFQGVSGGGSGGTQDSPTNYPLVQLRSLESGQSLFLSTGSAAPPSATSFVSAPIAGLAPGYALATIFTNGTPSGSAIVLLLADLPAVQTGAATGVTSGGATLQASASAQWTFTAVSFEYSTDPALLTDVAATPTVETLAFDAAGSAVGQTIGGLAPSTTYYYRAVATSSAGSVQGGIVSFTTPSTVQYFFAGTSAPHGLVLNVLTGQTSTDGGTLSVTSLGRALFGAATISSDHQTILYTPRVSFAALGVSDTFTYTVTDSVSGATTTESVAIGNFAYGLKGVYDALVSNGAGTVGYLRVTLTGTGALTGSLSLGAVTSALKGQFGLDGAATIPIAGGANVTLTFNLAGGNLMAQVTKSALTASATLTPSAYAAGSAAPQSGAYTVLLPAPAEPTGGSAASATATVVNRKVANLTLGSGGSGYLAPPLVSIYGAGGSGALFLATLANGAVNGFTLVSEGSHYPDAIGTVTVAIDPPSAYLPAGAGYALMTVTPGGTVTLTGKLSDGSPWSAGGLLKADGSVAFYTALAYKPGPAGSLSGSLTFRNIVETSDADGTLAWAKPAQTGASLYRSGFTASVSAIASRYAPPIANQQALVFSNATTGAATVTLQGGDLADALSDSITVSAANAVKESPPASDKLKLTIGTASGLISGSFTGGFAIGGAPTKSLPATFFGALFQKQNRASGFYVEGNHSGEIDLTPQ